MMGQGIPIRAVTATFNRKQYSPSANEGLKWLMQIYETLKK
jgi:hypothetical protein